MDEKTHQNTLPELEPGKPCYWITGLYGDRVSEVGRGIVIETGNRIRVREDRPLGHELSVPHEFCAASIDGLTYAVLKHTHHINVLARHAIRSYRARHPEG